MTSSSGDDLKNEIRRATDIVHLISGYVPLKRAGRRFKALCPFHREKTPSFTVNPELEIFKCFGCGAAGDVFSFVMKMDGVEFPEAMRMLAERAGIDTTGRMRGGADDGEKKALLYRANEWASKVFQYHLADEATGKACRGYVDGRGIEPQVRERFRLGYANGAWEDLVRRAERQQISRDLLVTAGLARTRDDGSGAYDYFRDRLMFPITGVDARTVAFGGRAMDAENPAKYLNSPDTPIFSKGRVLYGLSQSRQPILDKRQAVVVEGYTDVIMAHQHGVENVVAVLGTALTRDHIRLLRRYADEVVVVFDGDAAGQNSADRSVDLFVEEDMPVRLVGMPTGQDPCDFVREHGADAFRGLIEQGLDLFDFKIGYLQQRHDTSTTDGKAAVAGELVATAVLSPEPVRRDLYLRRIGEELGLSETAVRAQAARITQRPRVAAATQEAGQPQPQLMQPKGARAKAERALIKSMLTDNALVPRVEAAVGEEGFGDSRLRLVAREAFRLYKEDAVVDARRVLDAISDPQVTEVLADVMTSVEPVDPEGSMEYLAEKAIPTGSLTATRERMLQAAREGDEEAERRLLAQYRDGAAAVKGPKADESGGFDET